jgi:AraC-like DNA-binding protein
MTVFAWIRQHKLSMSCELLKSNQLSIGQISELLGYSSQAYFTKSFKEAYNCTPTDYMSQAN